MSQRLEKIYEIISFYDDCRWNKKSKDNLINYFRVDLDDDTKLLTHWLCYIADRQMSFERIWDVGGFVFSELIHEIKSKKLLSVLNPKSDDKLIIYENNKFSFISKSNACNNKVLLNYNISGNVKVKFKSRFLPSDYISILNTFLILEDYNYSLSKFIKISFKKK